MSFAPVPPPPPLPPPKHKKNSRSETVRSSHPNGSANGRTAVPVPHPPPAPPSTSPLPSSSQTFSSTIPLTPARPTIIRTASVPSSHSPQPPPTPLPPSPFAQPGSPLSQPRHPPSPSIPSHSLSSSSTTPTTRFYPNPPPHHRQQVSVTDLPPPHPPPSSSVPPPSDPPPERRNSRAAFPFPFSPANTASSTVIANNHPNTTPNLSPGTSATSYPPSPPKHGREGVVGGGGTGGGGGGGGGGGYAGHGGGTVGSQSPPSTPQLRTFLNEGATHRTSGADLRGRGDVTPPSSASLPPLSLSQQGGGGSWGGVGSAPSSPVAPTSRPSSPHHSPESGPYSSKPSSPLTHTATSHVMLHVRRAREESNSPSTSLHREANHSTPSHPSSSSSSSSSKRTSGTTSSNASNAWAASPRREGQKATADGERSRSSISSSTPSSSPSSSPSLFSLLTQPSLFFLYLQKIRKHYMKPEDKQRPSLQSAGLSSSFFPSSLTSFLTTSSSRPWLRWLLYGNLLLALMALLWWWMTSSALPLSFLLSFYFPSSVSPQSIYYHSPPPAALFTDVGVASPPTSTFTVISILDLPTSPSFLSPSALTSSPGTLLRWHALMSWVLAVGPINVMVYVEHDTTCTWLIERPELRGLKCFLIPSIHPTYKRPILPALFEHAHSHTGNHLMAFMARPAFLHPLIHTIVGNVSSSLERFMLVTRRTNVVLPTDTLSPYTFSLFSPSTSPFVVPSSSSYLSSYQSLMSPYISTLTRVFEYADHYGKLHSEYGIDLFIYPKSIFSLLQFPPYLAGVYRWDNWWLSEMILHDDVTVVDLSSTQLPLLTHDGDKTVDHPTEDGAHYNDRITKLRSGNQYKLGHANNADYKLEGRCPHCYLMKNSLQSIAVLLAKRINRLSYLAVLTFESTFDDSLQMRLLHNWVCWSKRIGFTHFIILVQDVRVATHLTQYGIPVIHKDNADDAMSLSGGGSGAGGADLSDFAVFHIEVLRQVLKAGYHFFTGPVTSIFLDDPLVYLHRQLDVQLSINITSDQLTPSTFWAVRATTYGRDFIMKMKDCIEKTKIIPKALFTEQRCLSDTWKLMKKNKAVKRGALDDLRFITGEAFFKHKTSQAAGLSAVAIDLTDQLKGKNGTSIGDAGKAVLDVVNSWHMLIHYDTGKGVGGGIHHQCMKPLYPALPAPSDSIAAPFSFSLKVKIIASFRPRSLLSLLRSLQAAVYDDDQVELEVCIDGLPAVNPTDKEKAKHAEVKKIVSDFVWTQGPLIVTEEKESKKGPGETGDWKGKGAFSTFLSSWTPSSSNPHQVLLLLPEYVVMSPAYYQFIKRTVSFYFLDKDHYDPAMYGISLQSNLPILATDYDVAEALPVENLLYRYQMYGSLGTVLFPSHWLAFQKWLQSKHFNTDHGMLLSLSLLDAFTNSTRHSALFPSNISNPCVPPVPSNMWWLAWNEKYNRPTPTNTTLTYAIDHLFPLFFGRWLYEVGYYALFPHFPDHQQLVLQSEEEKVRTIYAWSQDKENRVKQDADARPRTVSTLPFYSQSLPSLSSLPLFDVAGYDLNPPLDAEESHQDEEDRLESRHSRVNDALDEDSSMTLSHRGNRERSKALAFRPYQWSRSSQCMIVMRNKKREEVRAASMTIGQLTAGPPVLSHHQAGVRPGKKSTPPAGGGGDLADVKKGDGKGVEAGITPSKKPVEEDQGEEEPVDRDAFLRKWKEGGRSD